MFGDVTLGSFGHSELFVYCLTELALDSLVAPIKIIIAGYEPKQR